MDIGANAPILARARPRRRGEWSLFLDGDAREYVAIDLSAGGLFAQGVTTHLPGAHLRIDLRLRNGPLRACATVRWVRPDRLSDAQPEGAGVSFDDLRDSERHRIAAELEQVAS